jgi:hypothetical protein
VKETKYVYKSRKELKIIPALPFYLPHMEYEGSIGFVLGLFTTKNNDLSKKKSVCHAPL